MRMRILLRTVVKEGCFPVLGRLVPYHERIGRSRSARSASAEATPIAGCYGLRSCCLPSIVDFMDPLRRLGAFDTNTATSACQSPSKSITVEDDATLTKACLVASATMLARAPTSVTCCSAL